MFKYIILLIFAILGHSLFAQETPEDVSVNSQIWVDYNDKYSLAENRIISGLVGYRSISPHIFDKYLVVSTYDIINTESLKFINRETPLIHSFHLGAGLFYTDNHDGSADNFELRLVQGLKFFLPSIKWIPMKNYIRLEERFQKSFDGSYWNAAFRLRYKISTVIEWNNHLLSFNKGMYIPMSIEFFFNLKEADRYNDVIRISPGLGYKFNDDWKAEFYVSYHHSTHITENEDSSNDFVFRLRIYKSSLKKAKVIDNKEEEIKELIE